MDPLAILIILVVIALYAVLDDEPDESDPLDLARPSLERLDREAERAMAELWALDSEERRR